MSRSPVRLVAHLLSISLIVVVAGGACSDTFNCQDSFNCEVDEGAKTGGAGGEKMTSSKDGGAGGMSEKEDEVLVCKKGTLDCNDDPEDGCEVKSEGLEVPPRPESRRPLRSEYTGSLHARKTASTLRPTFIWSESEADCGELRYEIEIDDSCLPGELAECEFDSPEVQAESSEATFTPAKDLPVSEEAPVGALYTWRVRACDTENCSDWSDPAPVNVGRTLQDLNGDGYGDAMVLSDRGTEIYLGALNFSAKSVDSIAAAILSRFVGDLNGDGFADLAFQRNAQEECGVVGRAVEVAFGASNFESPKKQLFCRTAGEFSQVEVQDVGDLNGDGFDELAITWGSYQQNSLLVFLGAQEVSSQPAVEPLGSQGAFTFGWGGKNASGRADYNGDGFSDVVAGGDSYLNPDKIFVFLGAASLSRKFDFIHQIESCRTVNWIDSAGDLNNDSLDDWVVACKDTESSVRFLYGGSEGGDELAVSSASSVPLTFISPALDFDGDGADEFFVGGLADGPGIWRPELALDENLPNYSGFNRTGLTLDVTDLNGDARDDIIMRDSVEVLWAPASSSFNHKPIPLQLPADVEKFTGLGF